MSKHTDGPWIVGGFAVYAADNRTLIAHTGICGNHLGAQRNEANAKLIAAAPELLEKAQALLDSFGGDTPSWCSFEAQALAATISKATE